MTSPSIRTNSSFTSIPRVPSRLALQGWQLTTLAKTTHEEQLEIDLEIEQLEQILDKDVGEWEQRLSEINHELSGKAQA